MWETHDAGTEPWEWGQKKKKRRKNRPRQQQKTLSKFAKIFLNFAHKKNPKKHFVVTMWTLNLKVGKKK